MADVSLTAAFSTVPAGEAEAIKRVLVETIEQIAKDDGTFARAKVVFTESDERCGLTAELDGVKKEGVPLQLDIEVLVDARVGEKSLAALGRLGQRVAPREETYATLNFAKPVGVRVGRRGLEAGLDALRPAAAAGH